jgi:parvulin-like peptidyl-prolyl isomerase
MLSKLYNEVTEQVKLSDEEIKKEYTRLNEKISLYYIASQPLEFLKSITPSEEEIKDFFTKKSIQFKQPLSFNLEYISLVQENKYEGAIQDEIKKITLRLNKKEDFIKVAKDFNLQAKETGLFSQTDPIPGIGWSAQILGLLEKVKVGEYLPPIKMDKYYYILKLKERKEPYVPDFDTIKDKVKDSFIKHKSQNMARQKIEDCLKELKTTLQIDPKSIDFDKTAKVYGLKSGSTDLFQYGSYIEGIGASDTFWMRAQNLKENDFSDIVEMDPAGFYIIKLKSKIPIDEKKFGEEKTEFTQKFLAQKKEEYFNKYLEELKRKVER